MVNDLQRTEIGNTRVLPVLACFPVLTLFMGLFLVMLVVIMMGFSTTEDSPEEPLQADRSAPEYPAWWTFALIPVALAAVIYFLAWCTAGN